ncbi:hypothetical protein Tco_0327749 [Tanacetum coccineum]
MKTTINSMPESNEYEKKKKEKLEEDNIAKDRDALIARATILASSLVEARKIKITTALNTRYGLRNKHRLRDSGAEDGVHPRTPIAVRKAQGILKITLKVKTVKATELFFKARGAQIKERKKAPQAWRHPEGNHRQNFKKGGGFRSQHKPEEKIHSDRFAVLTKLQRILLALEKKENKTPPPMTTPVEKRNANKFCEFHGEVGHNTDECNQLKKQIKDMLKAGKLSHIIRELKQNTRKEPRKGMVRPPEKKSLRQF